MRKRIPLATFFAVALFAQSVMQPRFKTASLALSPASRQPAARSVEMADGLVTLQTVTMQDMLSIAFTTEAADISGPNWLNTEHYDVAADSGTRAPVAHLRLMLQALLIDRCKLEFHREAKPVTSYAIVAKDGGSKLVKAGSASSRGIAIDGPNLVFRNYSMSALADYLSTRTAGLSVKDETGIQGSFDFSIRLLDQSAGDPADVRRGVEKAMSDSSLPAMLTDQIGLKMEKRTRQVSILVVDHMERIPSGN
jgi:uncharacterized protein (TIGR03435 family)